MLMRFQYNACSEDALWVTILEINPKSEEEPWDPNFGPSYFKQSDNFITLARQANLPTRVIDSIRNAIAAAIANERGSWARDVLDLDRAQLDKLGFRKFRIKD
jgi:hypothetical protein